MFLGSRPIDLYWAQIIKNMELKLLQSNQACGPDEETKLHVTESCSRFLKLEEYGARFKVKLAFLLARNYLHSLSNRLTAREQQT